MASKVPGVKDKKFTIRVYSVESSLKKNKSKKHDFSNFFDRLSNKQVSNTCQDLYGNDEGYQFNDISKSNDPKGTFLYQGVITKFRPEKPSSGQRNTAIEKIVELEPQHEILEKTHFVIFRYKNIEYIAFQCSMSAPTVNAMIKLMNLNDSKHNYIYSDLLTTGSIQSLLSGKVVKAVEFRISKPTSKKHQPAPDATWTKNALKFIQEQGASTFEGKIVTYSPSKGLVQNIVSDIGRLINEPTTKKVKVRVSDLKDPIDLFGDRIKSTITVSVSNGVLNSNNMYNSIKHVVPKLTRQFP